MSMIRWLLAVLVVAALSHAAALYFGPSLIMSFALGRISTIPAEAGKFANWPRPNADNDRVVMSSPDLLYSTCIYDVSEKPVVITAEVPPGEYWSVAFYDMNTNNFRTINDRQATSGGIRIVIVKAGTPASAETAGAETIVSPTGRGLVLIRTLVSTDAALAEVDHVRQKATCRSL